jgi:secondary thiamine-phosphate synthase enzyme
LVITTTEIELQTCGHCDVQDITPSLLDQLKRNGLQEGQVLVFVAGSTAGVTTVEFEPGLLKDLSEFFQKIIPEGPDYHHHDTWGDDNGSSHVRASLLKPSLTIPFSAGRLLLGTWQQVVIIDFDTRPRKRKIVLQFTGE